jgi:hypothetical protein
MFLNQADVEVDAESRYVIFRMHGRLCQGKATRQIFLWLGSKPHTKASAGLKTADKRLDMSVVSQPAYLKS